MRGHRMGLTRRVFAAGAAIAVGTPLRAQARRLRLGHGLPATHPVHPPMEKFAQLVREGSGGAIDIQIFADGQLGQELDLIDQVRAGKLDLMKASATVLEQTAPAYRVFNLPFLIRNTAHYRAVTTGAIGEALLTGSAASGYLGLTFYDAGARSFYGHKAIEHPDNLVGMKIRVQPSPTMVRMVELFRARPVTMVWGVVRGALMTRIIDGAENNLSALSGGAHADVISHYSFTEHTFVPDVLLIGTHVWSRLSGAEQDLVQRAAHQSFLEQSAGWAAVEAEGRRYGEALGVTFLSPEKAPFMEMMAPLRGEFEADASMARLVAQISAA